MVPEFHAVPTPHTAASGADASLQKCCGPRTAPKREARPQACYATRTPAHCAAYVSEPKRCSPTAGAVTTCLHGNPLAGGCTMSAWQCSWPIRTVSSKKQLLTAAAASEDCWKIAGAFVLVELAQISSICPGPKQLSRQARPRVRAVGIWRHPRVGGASAGDEGEDGHFLRCSEGEPARLRAHVDCFQAKGSNESISSFNMGSTAVRSTDVKSSNVAKSSSP